MKRALQAMGAIALCLWTLLGLFVWGQIALHEGSSAEPARAQAAPELAELTDQVSALHGDLRTLADTLAQNLQSLQDNLELGERERAAALERELAALREELSARIDAARSAPATEGSSASPAAEEPGPEPAVTEEPAASPPVAEAPVAPEAGEDETGEGESAEGKTAETKPSDGKKSFLAFRLPSDDFRFDERRVWSVLPALSRVGFDGSSTLHDFTGKTSHVAGELEVDPSRPADAPRGRIQVEAATLDTGNEDRDADMQKYLGTDAHPELLFELERFVPATVDAKGMRVEGTATGALTIHGVKRTVSMAVKLSLDEARRLKVDGEMPLLLSDFGVSVPSKLVISMKDEVKVWISLRLRASARR